jgi:hypothetical protein
MLGYDSTENWQPFEPVRQNKVFSGGKLQFGVGNRSKIVGPFLSCSDIII